MTVFFLFILVLNNLSTSSHRDALDFPRLCDGTLSAPLAAIITTTVWKKDSVAQSRLLMALNKHPLVRCVFVSWCMDFFVMIQLYKHNIIM